VTRPHVLVGAAVAVFATLGLVTPTSAVSSAPSPRLGAPDQRVIGDGTPAGCTSAAVVRAVRRGGVIRFDCGPDPVTIVMQRTAEVLNTSERVVIDGGGLVTLSGGGERRILRQDTCDETLIWTTDHCDDQATPRLVIKRLTLRDGYVSSPDLDEGSGGAISVRGGRLRIVHSRFIDNRCTPTGPDHGGAAVRVLDQYRDRPVTVRDSEFTGGVCSNGGALSSIGVSWNVIDSVFTRNHAIGHGANPAGSGTPGGGSGGAIYADGNTFHVRLSGTTIERNRANEGGGAIFFVSNDRTGTLSVDSSVLARNPSLGFENFPGIFFLGRGRPTFTDSVIR
jgi:Chlamydia polymorphic membrane protein (Chlamydia_PMP) repeat